MGSEDDPSLALGSPVGCGLGHVMCSVKGAASEYLEERRLYGKEKYQ